MQQPRLPAKNTPASYSRDIVFLLIVLGGLFFIMLGIRPLYIPDEGRYAEIAREMAASQDYITPYLNHIKYFEKPILFYWLGATAIKIAGLNLWSLRSINALLGLFGCVMTYLTARKLYNRTTGLLAALILGTSVLYFVMAHMISLDLPLTVFLSTSLFAFLLGVEQPAAYKRRWLLYLSASMAALAVLTKGLVGIVFPAMIVGTWMVLLGEWRLLKRLPLISSLVIFTLIAAPWHWLVSARNPEFFHYYFIVQHIQRYTDMDVGHYQPSWFFVPYLIIGLFPWVFFLPQAVLKLTPTSWKERRAAAPELYFLLWALIIFVFFSFSKSKLIPYILPIFPPLAIVIARYLNLALLSKPIRGIQYGCIGISALTIVIGLACYQLIFHTSLPNPKLAAQCLIPAVTLLLAGSLAACWYANMRPFKAIMLIAASTWLFLLLLLGALPAIDRGNIAPLAAIIKPILHPGDEVIAFNQYYQDLPFYLEKRVSVLNWKNEMSYGMEHQDTKEWMINDKIFWKRWHSPKRVFTLMGLKEFERVQRENPKETFYLLGNTTINVLISNQKNT